jgi:hypothetical protein
MVLFLMLRGRAIGLVTLALAACSANAKVADSGGAGGGRTSGSGGAAPTGPGGAAPIGSGGAVPTMCREAADCTGYHTGLAACMTDRCLFGKGWWCMEAWPTCTSDTDCANAPSLPRCDQCPGGPSGFCVEGVACTPDQCDPGTAYDASQQHCVAIACQMASECPPNFTCPATTGTCVRKTCTADADCKDYCVTGYCFESLGTCVYVCT